MITIDFKFEVTVEFDEYVMGNAEVVPQDLDNPQTIILVITLKFGHGKPGATDFQ